MDDPVPGRSNGDDCLCVVLDLDHVQDREHADPGQLADFFRVRHLSLLALDHDPHLADCARSDVLCRLPYSVVRGPVRQEQNAADHAPRSLRHSLLDLVFDPCGGVAANARQRGRDQYHPDEGGHHPTADRGAAVHRSLGRDRHDANLCRVHGWADRLHARPHRSEYSRSRPRPRRRILARAAQDHLPTQLAGRRRRRDFRQRHGAGRICDERRAVRTQGQPARQHYRHPGRLPQMGVGLRGWRDPDDHHGDCDCGPPPCRRPQKEL